jgi:hypothetical protein
MRYSGETPDPPSGTRRPTGLKARTVATYARTLRRAIGEAASPTQPLRAATNPPAFTTDAGRVTDAVAHTKADPYPDNLRRLATALAAVRGAGDRGASGS